MRMFWVAVIALGATTNSYAELRADSASRTCAVIKDTGLAGGAWTERKTGEWSCISELQLVDRAKPEGDTLQFIGEGQADEVKRVKLVLNMVQAKASKPSTALLVKAAQRLSIRTLGQSLPPALHSAIASGVPAKAYNVGTGKITVTSSSGTSNTGYALQVSIE